jgi:hypothetical protein
MGPVEHNVEFGIERFAADRKVEMPLRDALFVFKAIGEFIAFFHQPGHWRTIADVERFIGTSHEGGLHVLWDAYYRRLRDIWPADVEKALDDGLLDRDAFIDGDKK